MSHRRPAPKRLLPLFAVLCLWILGPSFPARAQEHVVRLAVQKTGTVSWELDVARRHGFDAEQGVRIEPVEIASAEAARIAMRAGAADVFVTDWLWVSRERSLGNRVQFVPYSASVGAVMVPPNSATASLADLRGRRVAVAGGPLDKSWLIVRGAAASSGLDLAREAEVLYGAPPLLQEKTLQGEADATLTYWNFAARLQARGYRPLLEVGTAARVLGATGPVAMIGYVFQQDWADGHADTLRRFLAAMRQAEDLLAHSDEEWERIAPLTQAGDAATLAAMRERYRAGVPRRPVEEEEADAARLYAALARLGGAELVGPAPALDPGTYYRSQAQR